MSQSCWARNSLLLMRTMIMALFSLLRRYQASHPAALALMMAAAMLFASGCTTTSTHRRDAITQMVPQDPELQKTLWRRSSVLKAALDLCGDMPLELDGGGTLSITMAGVRYPELSLDWVYARDQLVVEVADPTGATPFKLRSDARHAQLNHAGRTTELQWTGDMSQPRWSYQGHDLLMNQHDLGCLLAGGIPPSWQHSQGRWRFGRKGALFQGVLAGHDLRLTHLLPRQQLCMAVRRQRWWTLLHTKRLKICYQYSPAQPGAAAGTIMPPSTSSPYVRLISAHLELNKYRVRITHRPERP